MMIKHLVLDFDGVLMLREDVVSVLEQIFRELNIHGPHYRELVNKYSARLDLGLVGFDELIAELNELGKDVPGYDPLHTAQFFTSVYKHLQFNHELINFAIKHNDQWKISLFSNNYKENVAFIRKHLHTDTWTYKQIWSCDCNMVKPDRRFYEHLLQTIHAHPAECIFVDDRKENIEAARSVGMHAILFTNNAEAIAKLSKYLE